jgi:hypothetical protein
MRAAIVWAAGSSLVLLPSGALASAAGIGGYSGNPGVNGGATCSDCHFGASGAVVEIIDGASGSAAESHVRLGTTRNFILRITGGPAQVCGFDVSADGGALSPTGSDTQFAPFPPDEITHAAPLAFGSPFPVCEFSFSWQAPGFVTSVTLYGAGNSANGDKDETGDAASNTSHSISVPEASGAPLGASAALALAALAGRRGRRRRSHRR